LCHRRRNDCCCDSCCGSSCCGSAPKAPEPIQNPKKANEPPREVRIDSPATTPATTPALEVAPTAVPGLDADNRNPF
jgi:hypothetical protein